MRLRCSITTTKSFTALSHDEVVHGKGSLPGRMPGDHGSGRIFGAAGNSMAVSGKKLIDGGEFWQRAEWNANADLDWRLLQAGPFHLGLQRLWRNSTSSISRSQRCGSRDFDKDGFMD